MNEWTDEDWRLITQAALGEHLTIDEDARVDALIRQHRGGPYRQLVMVSCWIQGYCEALVTSRLRQAAAEMVSDDASKP